MVILYIIVGLILAYALYELVAYLITRASAKVVDSEEFGKDLRRVQLVDVREKDEFKHAHILGARNIPYSQFKIRYKELRKDTPVYLYDAGVLVSGRSARILKKAGYKDIYILKGGYANWNGKVKKTDIK
ncbi:Rhodanese-related sulfurtransferase [Granulicatella balaenopterae]|uniref:Rhodanese-related sulfurtransferase n=1 Tax=Granulicatella balaenopterae TaxID=137733 RepID=A0A1H9MRZ4_9LACT|nr:rhodanese-like domain-containing protein [Granulicatella balaenopterae]SER26259.1 Rhodanese-related sulfurtransferase [Granulicatella balaenopterae]